MVIFLITSILLLGLLAISVYFWQKPSRRPSAAELPPPINPRGLFDPGGSDTAIQLGTTLPTDVDSKRAREALLERAAQGDKSVLEEAHELSDPAVYNDVLNALVNKAESSSQLLSLVSNVRQHELPVNQALAASLTEFWQRSPDRSSTAKMLHIAALSDDAEVFKTAVELTLRFWREGKLADVSAIELQALFQGEFWVLSSGTRSSGAGFVLKRILASARNELDAAPDKQQDSSSI
jgi:hypothetical protein